MPKINLLSVAIGAAAVYGYMFWKARAQTAAASPLTFGPGPVKLNQ